VRAPLGLVAALLVVRLADESLGFLREGAFESWRSDLGLSYREAAVVLVAAAPGGIVGSAFSALADVRSRRAIASMGAFGYAASLLGFALGRDVVVLALSSFVLGVAATAMVHACEVALVDLAGADLEPAVGAANFFGAIGDLAGPLALVVAAGLGWSWRVPFFVAAGVGVAYGVGLASLPIPPPSAHHAEDHPGAWRASLDLLHDAAIWRFGLVAALLVQLDEAYLAFVIAYLRRDGHLSTATATLVASAIVVGGLVGYWRAAAGAPRGTPAIRVRRACALLCASALGIALVPDPPAIALCGVGFGYATARFWVTFQASVLRYRPGRTGSVTAVVGNLEMLGFGFPIVIGAIADAHGLRAGMLVYTLVPLLMLLTAARAVEPVQDPGGLRRLRGLRDPMPE
jgi:predicted MFS family arabinose efflux permease